MRVIRGMPMIRPLSPTGIIHRPGRTITRWHKFVWASVEGGGGRCIQNAPIAFLHACLDINLRYDRIPRRGPRIGRNYQPAWIDFPFIQWNDTLNCPPKSNTHTHAHGRVCVHRDPLRAGIRCLRLADWRNCRGRSYREKDRPFRGDDTVGNSPAKEMAVWVLNFCRRALRG